MQDEVGVLEKSRGVGLGLVQPGWLPAIWIGSLLLVGFGPTLLKMGGTWFNDSLNMEHGPLVAPVAAYMVWQKWDKLKRIPQSPTMWGLVLVFWGVLQSVVSKATQQLWGSEMGFLICLVGCILTLYGFQMVREIAYPLVLLLIMIAPPAYIYERLTLQLQLLASRLAEVFLEFFGYSVLREGNILELVGERLAVAEACSGIRSLMALLFMCATYCYFWVSSNRIRGLLLVAVIPIAIICNSGRIVLTGIVGQYNRELAHGMLHATFGYVSLILGAVLVIGFHRFIGIFERRHRHA
jgi:exosortase